MVIATGARYRRLEVPDLERFEGACVHYWASPLEERLCTGPGGSPCVQQRFSGGRRTLRACVAGSAAGAPAGGIFRREGLATSSTGSEAFPMS